MKSRSFVFVPLCRPDVGRRARCCGRFVAALAFLVCVCSAQTVPNTPFSSGFDRNTVLAPLPTGAASLGVNEALTGTDTITGYTWPFTGWNPTGFGVSLHPYNYVG